MENRYSAVIEPSDGVRRFLCRRSVFLASLLSLAYSVCTFRMTRWEQITLGSSLRSSLLLAACLLLPLGLLTGVIFARVKAMGMAYCMLSLLATTVGAGILFCNALGSLLRERQAAGVAGSLLEWLVFGVFLALCCNLVAGCMEFRLKPVWGTAGMLLAGAALLVTVVRTAAAFRSMRFAWDPAFDWTTLAVRVKADRLTDAARWIFRSIPLRRTEALPAMLTFRLRERITSCGFYAFLVLFFYKYRNESKAFNRLVVRAEAYEEFPKARIVQSIGRPAPIEEEAPPRRTGAGSVRGRLTRLNQMARAKEQGLDITFMDREFEEERRRTEDDTVERAARRRAEETTLSEEERRRIRSRRDEPIQSGHSRDPREGWEYRREDRANSSKKRR